MLYNNTCIDAPFSLTTTDDTDYFAFHMEAAGTFYIDWGDGEIEEVTRNLNDPSAYSHNYDSKNSYTIRLGGTASAYDDHIRHSIDFGGSTDYNDGIYNTNANVLTIKGSLGTIFGTIYDSTTNELSQPRFYGLFAHCTNLTGNIPETLFSGVYGSPAHGMFYGTFLNCPGLTGEIPENLFSGISGEPAPHMFDSTFAECTGLTGSIPENLFVGIQGNPSEGMFSDTFRYCTGLTGAIPENLFSGISGAPAKGMYQQTFAYCSGLSGSIPENLFSGISGAPAERMFYGTFTKCSGLTGAIPENLFSGIAGTPAPYMFASTLSRCSNLTGAIPENLFAGISGAPAPSMFNGTFADCTGLTGSIPENLFSGISGAPASSMFATTFGGCSKLTGAIPENLFSGISGAPAERMFESTFRYCRMLTGSIPENLFAGISGTPAPYMFYLTFENCNGLTGSIPENLFSGISGAPAPYMFARTFSGCSRLTGSIPENLFSGISGKPAPYMFESTFSSCSRLNGFIPTKLFDGISGSPAQYMFFGTFSNCHDLTGFIDKNAVKTTYIPNNYMSNIDSETRANAQMMSMFYGTGLATQCPENTYKYNTPFAIDWNPKVSCEPCPDTYPNSETGADSIESCYADITYTYNYDTPTIHARAYYDSEKPDGYSIDLPEPTRDNYVFAGWTLENLESVDNETILNGNTTLYATWTLIPKFTITTTDDTDSFSFKLSAAGTFYVDWGDGTDVQTIVRNNTNEETYSHAYDSAGSYTIKFNGAATGYSDYNADYGYAIPAISFRISSDPNNPSDANAEKIVSVSGSLGQIFSTVGNPTVGQSQPKFYRTFAGAKNLITLPENLFDGVSGNTKSMFFETFWGCSGLSEIPSELFNGISGAADYMFYRTFDSCTGLNGKIPGDLFANVSGSATHMFDSTFIGCSNLTTVEQGLFDSVYFDGTSGNADYLFESTFRSCTNLSSIPSGLFDGITAAAPSMFDFTFNGCDNLRYIPSGLFNKISGTPATRMFASTFYNSGLTGFVDEDNNITDYIPSDFLNMDSNGYTTGPMNDMFGYTRLSTRCPANMYKSDSPFQNDWNPKVSCIPCPDDYPYSAQGSTSKNSCYTTGTTNCSAYNPYTSGAGTATYANESVYFKEYSDGQLEYGSDALNICAITDLDCPVEYTKTTEPTLACVPNVYTITYHINGGEIPAGAIIPETYTIESDDITLPAATREHYVFDGWCDDAEMTTNCEIIKTIPNGSTNNREFFAKWEKESIVCVAGEYLPAGANVCKKCPRNGYCEGGTFTYSEDIDNGITLCPPDEYGTPEYNSALNACVSLHTYGLGPGYLTGETLPNSELAANNNNIVSYQTCRYNPTTDAYTDCFDLSIGIFQIVCKNGYTVLNQQDISGWKSVWNATNNGNAIEIIKNGHVGEPYACVAAEPGYYTGVYDIVQKYISDARSTTTDELGEEFLSYMDSMSEKFGFGFAEGEIRAFEDTNVSFDEIYKKCPDAYPHSLAASWKQTHCYSNIKFNTNNGTVMPDMILHYDSTRPNGYSIDDLPVPTNDNNDVVFDGWYENSDFSGQKITSDTLLVGDKVLYAKWKFVCRSGIWLHFGYNEKDKACLSSTQPDKPRMVFNIDGDKYYLNISDDTQKQISEESDLKMYIFYGGQKRTIHDQSVE